MWQVGEGASLGITQEIEILPFYQMLYVQPRIRLGELEAINALGFRDPRRSTSRGQITKPRDN